MIKLIISLGNPGKSYAMTYHNVGHSMGLYLKKHLKLSSRIIPSETYMNESGTFVYSQIKKYKAKPEELLLIHDDSDIELGAYKLSFERGSAGHNGVKSVIQSLKTKGFWRLRIGIRKKTSLSNRKKADLSTIARRAKAEDFVLKPINATDKKTFERVFKSASEAVSELVIEG